VHRRDGYEVFSHQARTTVLIFVFTNASLAPEGTTARRHVPAILRTMKAWWVALCLTACAPVWRSTAGAGPSLYDHAWVWTDDQGHAVTLEQWRGTPLVVAAVYLSCDDVCPRTVARLRTIYDQYQREGRRATFVLLTLDPRNDSVEQLRTYKVSRGMPGSWRLLRGGTTQTQQLAAFLGIHTMDMGTHVVHDAPITVFDANGVSSAVLDL